MRILLTTFLLLSSYPLLAQARQPLYAAPGMPVTLPGRVGPTSPTPVVKPWLTEPLPRYWRPADSATRQCGAVQVVRAIQQRLHYPAAALRYGLGGRLLLSVQLSAAGVPQRIVVRKRTFMLATSSATPVSLVCQALEAEAVRIAGLLRFQPATMATDSLLLPMNFSYCW